MSTLGWFHRHLCPIVFVHGIRQIVHSHLVNGTNFCIWMLLKLASGEVSEIVLLEFDLISFHLISLSSNKIIWKQNLFLFYFEALKTKTHKTKKGLSTSTKFSAEYYRKKWLSEWRKSKIKAAPFSAFSAFTHPVYAYLSQPT